MNPIYPTTKKDLLNYSIRRLAVFFLLLAAFGYFTVPTVKADLPPETYYQGIDTGVNGDDAGSSALPIGFDFTFFGNTYSEFYVSSNGYIAFDNRDLTDYTNDDIASTRNPDNYIAPFWDDTTIYNGLNQYVYYNTLGTAPNRQLVVQYTNIGFWNDPTPLGTFSIILSEGSNNIQFQYRYLVGANSRAHGDSATVGLENYAGTEGTKYSFNTESLSSEQVILFTPNGSNYDISTARYAGILLGAGASASPDIPVQTTPLKGSTVSQTPTFSWGASANADSYELRIDNNANMGSLTLNPTNITGTSFTPSTPLPEDSYYWIVIAHNATDSSWSEQWVFTTSSNPPPPLPDTPLLTSPVQNATGVSLSPTFSWQTTPGADSYQLLVSENSDLSTPLIDQSGISATSFDASGLTADTIYYWSIIASNVTGSSQSSTRNFTTLHINTAPTANNDSSTVAEDSGTTQIDVLANDTDPDTSDVLAISSVGTPDKGGTAVLNANQIDYTPALNFFGTEVFTYTISDGNGGSDNATVTITVTAVNDTPTANDDSATVAEDSGTTQIDVLANDSDADTSDVLAISSVGTPDNGGTAVLNSNQIDYTPALNFFGTEVFTYTISDGNGGSANATVTITITAVNDTPTANDDSATVAEDSSTIQIDVLANDSDADTSDVLAISSVATPDKGGTAVLNSNQIDYTPALNFFGTEVFTYTISDGNGGSDNATVTITVTAVNDTPTANDDSATVAEDSGTTQIDVLANDSDADTSDVLAISSVGTPDNGGTAVINSDQIDYTPAPSFFGTETFTYTISDDNGGSESASVTITVTEINDDPTANDDSSTVAEDSGTTQIDVLANDTDPNTGDTLTITAVGTTDNGGTAVLNNNQIDYTPTLNFFGTEVFTYTVGDGNGGSDIATVTITVTAVNDAPTANDNSRTVAEDSSTIQINVLANDTDLDTEDVLSISAVSAPDNGGTAVLNNNKIDYTPALNFYGTETFTYTINDGNGGSDSATVTITVTAVNDAPTANDDSETIAEDSSTTQFDVLVNDTDPDTGDTLSIITIGATDNGGTAVLNSNLIDYTPSLNFFGTETFTYTISDGNGGSNSATVTVTVTEVNDTPTAIDDTTSVADDSGTVQIDVLANDSDPDTSDVLSIISVGTPDNGGTAVINNNQIDYTAAVSFIGTETFTYTISDGNGGSDTALVSMTIFVSGSNAAPTAEDDTPETLEDSIIVIDVLANDSDPDDDSLSITAVSNAAHGTAVIQGNAIKYTPYPDYYGSDTFTYTVSDGEFTDTAIVTVTVVSVNDLPQANLDTTSTMAGSKIIINVLENDNDPVEGSNLTITAVANPAHGKATTNGSTITYTPNSGFVGTETFTYTISDGVDAATGTVTVTVNPFQIFIPIVIK